MGADPIKTPDSPSSVKRQQDLAGKMPHERDESVDPAVPPPEPELKQASVDVSRGMVDTDRGAAMNVIYKQQKKRTT